MKKELLEIAKQVRKMQLAAVPASVVEDFRQQTVGKLFEQRAQVRAACWMQYEAKKNALRKASERTPQDNSEALARRLRLQDQYSAMPSPDLLKIDYRGVDLDDLEIIAGSLRKRRLNEQADGVYQQLKAREQSYRFTPEYQAVERDQAKVDLLMQSEDKESIWFGTDPDNIQPEDFGSLGRDGRVRFKHEGKPVEV